MVSKIRWSKAKVCQMKQNPQDIFKNVILNITIMTVLDTPKNNDTYKKPKPKENNPTTTTNYLKWFY